MKLSRAVKILLVMAVFGSIFLAACSRSSRDGENKATPLPRPTGGISNRDKQPGRTGFVGCFKDPNNPFDLDGHLERSSNNTPQRCVEICRDKGFAYAGVQYGQSCLCGNSYGKFGPADNCNMKCTGDSSQICGGYNSNSVYGTGVSVGG